MMKKCLAVSVICLLMLPSIAFASNINKSSNYNLIVKMKPYQFIYEHNINIKFYVNITNEGPDASDNFSCMLKVFRLFGYGGLIREWFKWLPWNASYSGSRIDVGDYDETLMVFPSLPRGLYIAKTTVYTDDNNPDDNVAFRIVYVWK